ncbi:MAG: 3'-5' exonuclease [Burkholderiaceae bacterium]
MPITDVMIDLETLGTRVESGVPILSVGWCCWDEKQPWPQHGPYQAAQLFVRNSPGMVDVATVAWWAKQGDNGTAFDVLLSRCAKEGVLLDNALIDLRNMVESLDAPRIWSHGSMFDIAILEYWYRRSPLGTIPWKYWQVMDTRTIYAACREKLRTANTHDAMADAINQASLVYECWERTRAARSGPR